MPASLFNNAFSLIFWVVGIIVALTVHEAAHALAADRLGDPTAKLMGRLTLNPLAHLDPLGTILLLLVHFGWGKPVPIDPFNLRNPRRDSALIALAGPTANLILAIICAALIRVINLVPTLASGWEIFLSILIGLLTQTVFMAIVLGVFNLIPIHPLDGFGIVEGLLPENLAKDWSELRPYGMIFLLFLIVPIFGSSPVNNLLTPVINFLLRVLLPTSLM